jgi:hypothetical protein
MLVKAWGGPAGGLGQFGIFGVQHPKSLYYRRELPAGVGACRLGGVARALNSRGRIVGIAISLRCTHYAFASGIILLCSSTSGHQRWISYLETLRRNS